LDERIRFHQYLQWLCERQLAGAARRASGLRLGLCRDLAVGAAPDGAEVWAQAPLVAKGVSIGAPPDPLGPQGQVWGLPPFDPHRLRADGYRSVSELLAANMRHAGALRIDHVMGLARQFWVPEGAAGADGAYVAYPLADMLGVLALESERARCLVIGEDLGTVPEGLRETLAAAGTLSYRVLPFERDGAGYRPPSAYPRQAWACVATHDLAPLAGWWDGVDIDERLGLSLMTAGEAMRSHAARLDDKAALIEALVRAGVIASSPDPALPLDAPTAAALHAFIAKSPAALAIGQIEDIGGERIAVNLPGTDRERPNWRRRMATSLEGFFDQPLASGILRALRATRAPDAPTQTRS
jgi:glycogen operon protein